MKKFYTLAVAFAMSAMGVMAAPGDSFENAIDIQAGENSADVVEAGYYMGAYFKYTATSTTIVCATGLSGESFNFYLEDQSESYNYSSFSVGSNYTYYHKVDAGATIYVLAKQSYGATGNQIAFKAELDTDVLQHGMTEDDPIAPEMGKRYWFDGGNAYFTYTAAADGVLILNQPSYCYGASYTVDGEKTTIKADSEKNLNIPVSAGKTYSIWTSASTYSIFCVTARFTQPKQGDTAANPLPLALGDNTLPKAAQKYFYKFTNGDDAGKLTVKAGEGITLSARTVGYTYDNLQTGVSGTMTVDVDMDAEILVIAERSAEAEADGTITASFSLYQQGDVESNPIVLTPSETETVGAPTGVKFYSIKNTAATPVFLKVSVESESINSSSSSSVKFYKKGENYQWSGTSVYAGSPESVIMQSDEEYYIRVSNTTEEPVNFRAWTEEIGEGAVYSSAIEAHLGENTVAAAGQRFYKYTSTSECRLTITVGNKTTTTLFFPMYDGDEYMGRTLISSTDGVYILAANAGETYVFRMTGAEAGDVFTIEEASYGEGQSRETAIAFDGTYTFDDLNPYNVWLVYEAKEDGVAVIGSDIENPTFNDNIYYGLNDAEVAYNNLRGYDSDYNSAMLQKEVGVKAGDKIYFHVDVQSWAEGKTLTVSVRAPKPGETSDTPIEVALSEATTIDPVGYSDSPRWYSFEIPADGSVTFHAVEYTGISLYDSEMQQISCGEYSDNMSVGGYYDDYTKELPAGKYIFSVNSSYGENALTITFTPATGIEAVAASKQTAAPAFNLAGQRVSKTAKGIVIMDGKKMILK